MVAFKTMIQVLDLFADEDKFNSWLESLSDAKFKELQEHPFFEIYDIDLEV